MLEAKSKLYDMKGTHKSTQSVTASLNTWHSFAVLIKWYPPNETLPPTIAEHLMQVITMFENGGTAANYLYYLKRVCLEHQLSVSWCEHRVELAVAGAKQHYVRVAGGPAQATWAMSKDALEKIVLLSWRVHSIGFAKQFCKAAVLLWWYLLRVPSEGIRLELGAEHEMDDKLTVDRHSSVWLADDSLYIKLRRRKHKPNGSLVIKQCVCGNGINVV